MPSYISPSSALRCFTRPSFSSVANVTRSDMYVIVRLCTCLLLVSLAASQRDKKLAENDPCGTGAQRGICKRTENCKSAADIIKLGGRPPLCGFVGSTALICCIGSKSISEQKCEEYAKSVFETTNVGILGAPEENITHCEWTAQELIVGGDKAKPKVFPHMALIGYGKSEARREWLCGGSLISDRFILSAAHCAEVERMKAGWARLGELDLSTETEDARPVDFRIIESFVPKEYKKQTSYHDIALFKLEDKVRFNQFMRPICLHTSLEIQIEDKHRPIVTGWGRLAFKGQFSPDLRQLKVDLVGTQACTSTFKKFEAKKSLIPQGINGELMLCAGGVEGQDSCGGDSGGPLQIALKVPFCMFSQIGVVSFGNKCAVGDPGVYTRVSYFVPWIESIVWPN